MEHFDVAIIGLGPAGAALARQLSGKMRVIALDKKRQCGNEGFTKPCGGLLAPDAQRSFIRDGITLPVDVIANPQIFSVKTIDVAASLTRNYQRSYININRHAFDLWLKYLIPDDVQVYHDSLCRKIWREGDKWHVIFRADGWEQQITARYLWGQTVRIHWCAVISIPSTKSVNMSLFNNGLRRNILCRSIPVFLITMQLTVIHGVSAKMAILSLVAPTP